MRTITRQRFQHNHLVQIVPALAFLLFVAACELASISAPTSDSGIIPPELSISEYPLKQPPQAESLQLYFADTVESDPRLLHEEERSPSHRFDFSGWSCPLESQGEMAICVTLGADRLVAREEYNSLGQGHVVVLRNGKQIYRIGVGQGSPLNALRGLWIYDDHWVIETAHVTNQQEGNVIYSNAAGQITVDGSLLNDQFDYEEAFGFQILHDKPFYFFKRNGKIGINYDGVNIPRGYDEVMHYGCCSAAMLNPQVYWNMVAFFAGKGGTWYYTEVGVFGK